MHDEKDMIDIKLDTKTTTKTTPRGKEANYFGNIRFARTQKSAAAVPYDQYRNEDERSQQQLPAGAKSALTFCGIELLSESGGTPAQISCLRQMYCPDCQQRLDPQSVRYEKAKMLSCCLPVFPLSCVYKSCMKHNASRKVLCKKCGANLGYWKCA